MTELEYKDLLNKIRHYINRIRRPDKRAYANVYATWLLSGDAANGKDSPDRPESLGVMAAQRVRMTLDAWIATDDDEDI